MATLVPNRRSQSARRDESQARLLAAAARLIEAEGFAAVTFDRVGAMAGYSRGLATHKFGNKDGLVRAVIAFVTARVQAKVDAAIAALDSEVLPATTRAKIQTWTETLLTQVETDPLFRAYFVMMAAAIGNRADIRAAFLAAHEDVRTGLRLMIEEGQASGEITTSLNADATALSIGSLHLGIAVELLLDPAMDMAAMRTTAKQAVAGMLGSE